MSQAMPSALLNHRYHLQDKLGIKSKTLTWRALDYQTQQSVIVKELHFNQVDNWKIVELFEREIKTLKRLDHPRIPKIMDEFSLEKELDLWLYFVTTQVSGESLQQKMANGWRPTEKEVIAIAVDVLEVLSYLQGLYPLVIHRDIKPSNLMLDTLNRVHVIDFGAVKEALRIKRSSTIVGTFGYMAPEQYLGRAVPASDLYSLGTTLIHVLSGVPPADMFCNTEQSLQLNFKPYLHCSEPLQQWLSHLVEPEASQRFESATEALQFLIQPRSRPRSLTLEQKETTLPGSKLTVVQSPDSFELEIPAGHIHESAKKHLWIGGGWVLWGTFLSLGMSLQENTIMAGLILLCFALLGMVWMAKSLYSLLQTVQVHISRSSIHLSYSGLWGWLKYRREFPLAEITKICLEEVPVGLNQGKVRLLTRLYLGKKPYALHAGLSNLEQKWLYHTLLNVLVAFCPRTAVAQFRTESKIIKYRPNHQ